MEKEQIKMIADIASEFADITGSERVSVWAITKCGDFLYPVYMDGVEKHKMEEIAVDLTSSNGGLANYSAIYNDWLVLNKNDAEVKANSIFESFTGYQVVRSITMPIRGVDNAPIGFFPIGVLQGLNSRNAYTIDTVGVAETIAKKLRTPLLDIISAEENKSKDILQKKSDSLRQIWGVENQHSDIVALDTFIIKASGVMSIIWNLSKSLEIIQFYEDTVKARQKYNTDVFKPKKTALNAMLLEIDNMIDDLRKVPDENGKIRIFIHQLAPTLTAVSSALHILTTYFSREAENLRVYGTDKFLNIIKTTIDGLNLFHRLTKQYIYLDDTLKYEDVSAEYLKQWGESYELWFNEYSYNGEIKKINFRSIVDLPSDKTFNLDMLRLKECVDTLLTNAAEELFLSYCENPTISLKIHSDNTTLTIEVKDNGRGVPDKHKERIFEKYFTVDKPTGTGIGLGVVKAILLRMKGNISLVNNNGALFTITIPVSPI